MPKIIVKFDDNLPKKEIYASLTNTSIDESGQSYMDIMRNKLDTQQTNIYGIVTPLISINGITVDFSDVIYFSLKNDGPTPQLYIEVRDRHRLVMSINTPNADNYVCVQILPPFDNAYKKINLLFYISNMVVSKTGDIIKINGVYKVPDLISKQCKSLGKLSTYEMMEQIAKNTKLGFATNWKDETIDKRYIYCSNESYLDLMSSEIKRAFSDKTRVFDYWVDYWNYLNYVNIYERYTCIENLDAEENKIWVSSQPKEVTEGNKINPIKIPIKLTNHPALNDTELYVNKYEIMSNSATYLSTGTDTIYSIYEENKKEYQDHFFQNGDIKEDIFINMDYLGEVYGDYNYLLSEINRSTYLKKINAETIKIVLTRPLLAITKGRKVDFVWYNIDSLTQSVHDEYAKKGIIKNYDDIETNIPLDEGPKENPKKPYNTSNGEYKIDKSISGQYMVLNNNILYRNRNWYYEIILGRPYKDKPEILNEKL